MNRHHETRVAMQARIPRTLPCDCEQRASRAARAHSLAILGNDTVAGVLGRWPARAIEHAWAVVVPIGLNDLDHEPSRQYAPRPGPVMSGPWWRRAKSGSVELAWTKTGVRVTVQSR
jgi:hypothetical protein